MSSHLRVVQTEPTILTCAAGAIEVTLTKRTLVTFGESEFVLPAGTRADVTCTAKVRLTDPEVQVTHSYAQWTCRVCGEPNTATL